MITVACSGGGKINYLHKLFDQFPASSITKSIHLREAVPHPPPQIPPLRLACWRGIFLHQRTLVFLALLWWHQRAASHKLFYGIRTPGQMGCWAGEGRRGSALQFIALLQRTHTQPATKTTARICGLYALLLSRLTGCVKFFYCAGALNWIRPGASDGGKFIAACWN